MQDTDNQPPEEQEPGSPRSQSASRSTTNRSTPAAQRSPDSSPLSSPRSITPQPPSEDFKIEETSSLLQQTRSSFATTASSRSRSLRSQSSRSSSVFTRDDILKENPIQSDSSAPSCSAKIDYITSATEPEPERDLQSSPSSSISEDTPKDAPQLSQSSSTRTLPNLKGRDLFDSMVWSDPFTTSIFYMFISSLRQKIRNDVKSTTIAHKFLRTLRDGGRLVRNYTQNIDCLEEREGLSTDLTRGAGSKARFQARTQREPRPQLVDGDSPHNGGVECVLLHGSLVGLRCGICAKLCSWEMEERQSATLSGSAPDCPSCTDYNAKRTGRGRRGLAVGRLRPDIVLYGEEHPNANLIAPLITHDLSLGPDFLLIMGTSLKVHGLKVMVKEFAKAVHIRGGKVVFVNRTKPPESTWGEFLDYWVEWDCDEWVLDLQERRGDIWLPQGSQVELNIRRESAGDTKVQAKKAASRPQATRDDKMNGVYHTFKILDSLSQIKDSSGTKSTRPIYWDKPVRTVVAPAMKAEPSRQARKFLPATKPLSKEGNSKKRKSCPITLQDDRKPPTATEYWEHLRKLAPGLDPTPPETGRVPLKELHYNRDFPINNIFIRSFPVNHFPALAGLNLITHPPSGLDVPIHTPKSVPKPAVERRPVTHSYSTRASARLSGISTELAPSGRLSGISNESTIVVDDTPSQPSLPSWSSTEDTIVVAPPTGDEKPLTPPTSDPMTPSTQRIKRMGSIGAILSSPEDGARSDASATTVYYDAVEG